MLCQGWKEGSIRGTNEGSASSSGNALIHEIPGSVFSASVSVHVVTQSGLTTRFKTERLLLVVRVKSSPVPVIHVSVKT